MRANGLWLLLALAACQAPPPPEEPATASLAEVTLALRSQLKLVLERRVVLSDAESESARAEHDQLLRLAEDIAIRIVRVDPHADVDALIYQMNSYD